MIGYRRVPDPPAKTIPFIASVFGGVGKEKRSQFWFVTSCVIVRGCKRRVSRTFVLSFDEFALRVVVIEVVFAFCEGRDVDAFAVSLEDDASELVVDFVHGLACECDFVGGCLEFDFWACDNRDDFARVGLDFAVAGGLAYAEFVWAAVCADFDVVGVGLVVTFASYLAYFDPFVPSVLLNDEWQ